MSEAEFMGCLHPEDRIRIEGETEAFLTGDAESYSHSFRIVRPDGEVRYIIDRARIARDAEGCVTEIHGLNMDITDFPHLAHASMDAESKSAEIASTPNGFRDRERFEVSQRASDLVLADVDYRAGTVALSAAAARLFGLGDVEMTVSREDVHATFHPMDREALTNLIKASLDPKTGGRLAVEHRIVTKDGEERWLQVQKWIDFIGVDGRYHPDRGILAAMDITARKRAVIGLLDSDERLTLAQEVAGIGVWDINIADGHTVWTPELYKLLQIDPRIPATPDLFFEIVHPADSDRVRREFEIAIQKKSQFKSEFRIVNRNGEVRHISGKGRVTAEEDGRPVRMTGINYDITERRRAEEQLRENEAQLRMILDETAALVGIVDIDGTLREANRVALEVGGLEHSDVIGRPFWDAPWWTHDSQEVSRLKQAIKDAAAGNRVRYDATVKAADGKLRTIDFTLSPVLDNDGQVALLVPSALDVTERKNTERRLAESEARYRALFESINAGFCVVEVRLNAPDGRTDYRVVEANPAFYDQTGFPKVILNLWLREAAPDLEEHWYEIYGGVARTGESKRFEEHSKMLDRWFDVYAFPIDRPEEGRVAILFHNISDTKRHNAHVDFLLKEVNHRAKNMLSLINVIAKRTASSGTDGFIERFSDRISALAANQDILVKSEWKAVNLNDLVRSQLAHFEDLFENRIHVKGSSILIVPEAAEKLGMALHELTTNAGKYGALSNNSGQIYISWCIEQSDHEKAYVLEWRETDGPAVKVPERAGFGSLVSGTLLASGLGGRVNADYLPSGLIWRLDCPLASVTAAVDTSSVPAEPAAGQS
jgi:PAS domain S-box-containing protein